METQGSSGTTTTTTDTVRPVRSGVRVSTMYVYPRTTSLISVQPTRVRVRWSSSRVHTPCPLPDPIHQGSGGSVTRVCDPRVSVLDRSPGGHHKHPRLTQPSHPYWGSGFLLRSPPPPSPIRRLDDNPSRKSPLSIYVRRSLMGEVNAKPGSTSSGVDVNDVCPSNRNLTYFYTSSK